ncbi:agmatine deiminase family protein [Aestuariibacter sp. AA17]|uniref:Agmatine deiminase family protein n=1 Tax=Fluctibacter corallii TaxID=2984329 RepID=A0ABT3A851_9ALTE|nr:agmatine deiminase family protein [Aestuariibacter sp. AA17]MCV2884864.1 agmatine deiminase family protein [Aestuariibacter sp. AA17]
MFKPALLCLMLVTLLGCSKDLDAVNQEPTMQQGNTNLLAQKELIVVASPRYDDPYYAEVADDIFQFHVAYAKEAAKHDNFIVLTDEMSYWDYAEVLGEKRVYIVPQNDIWMRDFSLSNAVSPIQFRYTPAGQAGSPVGEAGRVQAQLGQSIDAAQLAYRASDWLNDGGNFVDDYHGRVVISRKFLRDNELTESEARSILTAYPSIDHVAFIEADEQGGLEHADGVVAFIAPNTLVINSYPDDPAYARRLKKDLEAGLPGVTIHNIVTPYDDSDIYDEKFGSACGLYTNMLVTPSRIYLPQFGIPEDQLALADIQRWTNKTVIPVQSSQVCHMGGGVRCMSWQLRGENAEKYLGWLEQNRYQPNG